MTGCYISKAPRPMGLLLILLTGQAYWGKMKVRIGDSNCEDKRGGQGTPIPISRAGVCLGLLKDMARVWHIIYSII